jgi:hypothetical protein
VIAQGFMPVRETAVSQQIDQQPAHAYAAHFAEGDLLRAGDGGHALLKRGGASRANGPGACAPIGEGYSLLG